MNLELVHSYIDEQFDRHLAKAQEFLRKPSISGVREGLNDTAQWLVSSIRGMGATIELVDGQYAPVIVARFEASKPKTLLAYGMYDVQAIGPELWSSPPFAAEIVRINNQEAIIARGACNSKGPLIGLLNAIQAITEMDDLPVNLILVIEGEEEVGSPTVSKYFSVNKYSLRADAAFDPFWAEYGTDVDRPTLTLGTKGVLAVDLIIRGGEWGGPVTQPVHSSVAGWLASPLWRLVKALSTIVNEYDEITVDGFTDEVIITPEDEELLSRIGTDFDGKKILDIEGAKRFKYVLPPVELLRRYFFSPTVGISLAARTDLDVIPTEARARLVFRLVPRMTPHRALEMLRRHFKKSSHEEVELEFLYGYPGARVSIAEPVVQSLIKAYAYHGHDPQVFPISASATPYYLFTDVLNIPYVWGGLGRAGKSHAPDEFATVEGLQLFEKSIATFLYMFGGA